MHFTLDFALFQLMSDASFHSLRTLLCNCYSHHWPNNYSSTHGNKQQHGRHTFHSGHKSSTPNLPLSVLVTASVWGEKNTFMVKSGMHLIETGSEQALTEKQR